MGAIVGRDMPDRESKEEHHTALNFLCVFLMNAKHFKKRQPSSIYLLFSD